jgi:hypothetical protein
MFLEKIFFLFQINFFFNFFNVLILKKKLKKIKKNLKKYFNIL